MKIQALKSIRGDYGLLIRGAIDEVSDPIARKLIDAGYAVEISAKPEPKETVDPVVEPVVVPAAPPAKKKAKPDAVDKDA